MKKHTKITIKARHTIDEKLLAHIFNDAFLLGSVALQGNRFKNAIDYLNQYIQTLSDEHVPSGMQRLQKACSQLAAYDSALNSSDLATKIWKDIQQVKPDDYLLIPGGWSGNPGHALIYEFQRVDQEILLFCIHNTGSGAEYHEQLSGLSQELHHPVLTYQLPFKKLNDTFVHFIEQLIAINAGNAPSEHTNAQYLYQSLFPSLHFWEGSLVDMPNKSYRAGQISGTCTQRSLHQILKNKIADEDVYRRFMYGFKAYSLEHYLQELRQKPKQYSSPAQQGQVKKALRQMIRFLSRSQASDPTHSLFSQQKQQQEYDKWSSCLQALNAAKKTPAPQQTQTVQAKKNRVSIPHFLKESARANDQTITVHTLIANEWRTKSTLLEQLCCLQKEIEQAQGGAIERFVTLEAFFVQLPFSRNDKASSYFVGISSDAASRQALYDLFDVLQKHYFAAAHDLIPSAVGQARMLYVKLRLMLCLCYINFETQPWGLSFLHYVMITITKYMESAWGGLHKPEWPCIALESFIFGLNKLSEIEEYQLLLKDASPALIQALNTAFEQRLAQNPSFLDPHELKYCIKGAGYDYRALYYVMNQGVVSDLDTAFQEEFLALRTQFELQYQLEQLMLYSMELFYIVDSTKTRTFCVNSKQAVCIYGNNLHKINFQAIHRRKYDSPSAPQDNATLYQILAQDQSEDYASNHTQLEQSNRIRRELEHIKGSRNHQIIAALDFFNQHLDLLAQKELQYYLEALIFQSPLLAKQLTAPKDKIFFNSLTRFLQRGMRFYEQQGAITQHSLFFLQLECSIYLYAAGLSPTDDTSHTPRLDELNQRLIQLIQQTENVLLRSQLEVLLLQLASEYQGCFSCKERILAVLTARFHQVQKDDLTQAEQLDFACMSYQLKRQLMLQKEHIDSTILLDLAGQFDINIQADSSIEGSFPCYQLRTQQEIVCTMNLLDGLLYDAKGVALSKMPLEIKNHPVFQQMGITVPALAYISHSGSAPRQTMVQFSVDGQQYRGLIDSLKNHYAIQTQWDDDWYQVVGSSAQQTLTLKLEGTLVSDSIPKSMQDRDLLTWVQGGTDAQGIKTIYYTQGKEKTGCTKCSKTAKDAWTGTTTRFKDGCQYSTQYEQLKHQLSSFEDQELINIWQAPSGELLLELPRYGLSLSATTEQGPIQLEYKSELYRLHPDASQGMARLVFMPEQGEGEPLCFMPIQRFISTHQRSPKNEYYELKQDIHASIISEINGTDTPLQYTHSEHYYCFKMSANAPVPETPEQALYLAYVYLGHYQPKKAWAVLNYCQQHLGGLRGTDNEWCYLEWIIKALPVIIGKNIEKEEPQSPKFVACKLKALALFTEGSLIKKEHKPLNPSLLHNPNVPYRNKCLAQLNYFREQLPVHVSTLLNQHQAMQDYLGAHYALNDNELYSLWHYNHAHQNTAFVGSSGYAWLQQSLKVTKKEWDRLQLKAQQGTLSAYEKQRQSTLLNYVREHTSVARKASSLSIKKVDLSLPAKIEITCVFYIRKVSLSDIELDFLVPGKCCLRQLSWHYSDLVQIASSTKTSTAWARLNKFCHSILIAHNPQSACQSPDDKEIWLLCNLLYRICCTNNPEIPFDDEGVISMSAFSAYARSCSAEDITIAEYQEDTRSILATAQSVWQALPTQIASEALEVDRAALNSIPLLERLGSLHVEQQQWHEISQKMNQKSTDGHSKFRALQALQALAIQHFGAKQLAPIKDKLCSFCIHSQKEQVILQNQIVQLANAAERPDSLRITLLSKTRKKWTLTDLLNLYCQNDKAQYRAQTQLSDQQVTILHQKIAQYLIWGLQQQQSLRALQCIERIQHSRDEQLPEAQFDLAKALFAQNEVDVLADPALALFQYHGNLLLRPDQKEAIARLLQQIPLKDEKARLRYTECIEKMIMGSGKSKVLLPTLAYKKANGLNLVMIEVPRALLETNFEDLRQTSMQLYKQKPHLFQFRCDEEYSAAEYEEMSQQLTKIMIDKDYLVTTHDALQSLELKYLELLKTRPSIQLNEWENKVRSIGCMLTLFRQRTDLIIDEVHQNLWIKNKLNYTLGESSALSSCIIKHCLALYRFLDQVSFANQKNLMDVLKNNQLLSKEEQFKEACQQLAYQLTSATTSPLHEFIQSAQQEYPNIKEELYLYLSEQTATIPHCVNKAAPLIRWQLALYKEELNRLLPYTLRRNCGEHYGPSQAEGLSATQRAIAIPYLANNVPNEGSRFGNFIEEINNTTQAMLIHGIPKELFSQYVQSLLTQAKEELLNRMYPSIDATAAALEYQSLIQRLKPDSTLSQLEYNQEETLRTIHEICSRDETLIFHMLEQQVLPHIRIDQQILHSDSFNHVDLVHSCQGVSGTPSNYSTFHQRLHFDSSESEAIDEYILSGIEHKKPLIHTYESRDPQEFIETLLGANRQYPHFKADSLRAIIDINATFKGIDNQTIARLLAQTIHKAARAESLKYVLYYQYTGHKSVLCAWDIQQGNAQKPIVLESSDAASIAKKLHCQPDACFTYYDQAHITGTDIKQAERAKAMVLIDHETNLQNFLQGSMRMRRLIEGGQNIEIVVPHSLARMDFQHLKQQLMEQEKKQIQRDNYEAALLKMTAIIRNDLMERLLKCATPLEKARFFAHVKSYFIESKSSDLFALYGQLSHERPTKNLLKEHQERLLLHWRSLVAPSSQAITVLTQRMQAITEQTLTPGFCDTQQLSHNEPLSTHVEVHKKTQKQEQQQVQKQVTDEQQKQQLIAENYERWGYFLDNVQKIGETSSLCFKTLNELCQVKALKINPEFSNTIYLSKNFYQTYKKQEKSTFLNPLLKPVHAILFQKNPLACVLLTQQEANELHSERWWPDNYWLSTTQHSVLASEPPNNILENQNYQSLVEQIRYFNAEIPLLLEKPESLLWIKNKTRDKLVFLRDHLSQGRDIDALQWKRLCHVLGSEVTGLDPETLLFAEEIELCRSKLAQIRLLCEEYMRHCLKSLPVSYDASLGYPLKDEQLSTQEQYRSLEQKYQMIKSLYDLTEPDCSPSESIRAIEERLHSPECHILKAHRNPPFIRLIAKLLGIIRHCVGLLFNSSSSSSFFSHANQSHGEVLLGKLEGLTLGRSG